MQHQNFDLYLFFFLFSLFYSHTENSFFFAQQQHKMSGRKEVMQLYASPDGVRFILLPSIRSIGIEMHRVHAFVQVESKLWVPGWCPTWQDQMERTDSAPLVCYSREHLKRFIAEEGFERVRISPSLCPSFMPSK